MNLLHTVASSHVTNAGTDFSQQVAEKHRSADRDMAARYVFFKKKKIQEACEDCWTWMTSGFIFTLRLEALDKRMIND